MSLLKLKRKAKEMYYYTLLEKHKCGIYKTLNIRNSVIGRAQDDKTVILFMTNMKTKQLISNSFCD